MSIAENIANWLIKNGANEEDKEVFIYGIECFVNEAISNLLLIVFGLFTNRLSETILWLFFFTLIRVNLGGYHASTHTQCILYSTLLGYFCLLVYPFITGFKNALIIVSLILLAIIVKIAPVIHKNHPVPMNKIKHIKYRAILGAITEVVLIVIFLNSHINISSVIFLALLPATVLGLIGYLSNNK